MDNRNKNIRLLNLQELSVFIKSIDAEQYRTKQIYEWIWKRNINSFDEIKNIPKTLINQLNKSFTIEKLVLKEILLSVDNTTKFAFSTNNNETLESVLIPSNKRSTACISTQTGCALNCSFCATGKIKNPKNLSRSEIYEQIYSLSEYSNKEFGKPLTNIVFMGMGEPLLNYENLIQSVELITSIYGLGFSPSRITVSTAGISKSIYQLANDNVKFKLAISLHSANDAVRNKLMPINKTNNLKSLIESIKYFYNETKQRVTFEYLLLKDVNDSLQAAKELAEFCKNFPCKINIIEYNPIPGIFFSKSTKNKQELFINYLNTRNLIINIRNSRGLDINAACGQLASIVKAKDTD